MPLLISDISSVLKKVIVPRVQSQITKENILFSQIKKNVGVVVSNNTVYASVRSGKHSGIYTAAENSEPYTGKAQYAQPYTPVKYAFGTLELTDQAIEAANQDNVKAVASILKTEVEALKDDFKLDINRMLHGDGTGKLCLADGTQGGGGSTALTVKSNPNGGDANEYISVGSYIVIGAGAAVQVTALTGATGVTLASARTWTDGDVVKRAGADEPMGLAGIIDDGDNVATIQNILRSANPWANGWTEDTAKRLAEDEMIKVYLKTRRYGGAKFCLMGEAMYRTYGALLTSQKRNTDSKPVLQGGWQGLEFMGGQCPVLLDFDTWSGYVHFVDPDAMTIAEMSDPFAWLEADAHGGILKRSASNRTVWEGTMKYYFNLIATKFRSSGRLSNKSET